MRRTIWKHRSNPKPPTLVFDSVGFFTRETIITLAALGAAFASGIGLGIAVARADEDLPHTRHDAEYARYARMTGGRPARGSGEYPSAHARRQAAEGLCGPVGFDAGRTGCGKRCAEACR